MIKEQKGVFSAGKALKLGLCRIGKIVFNGVITNQADTTAVAKEKGGAARLALATLVA